MYTWPVVDGKCQCAVWIFSEKYSGFGKKTRKYNVKHSIIFYHFSTYIEKVQVNWTDSLLKFIIKKKVYINHL